MDQDAKKSAADKVKDMRKEEIKKLKRSFEALLEKNKHMEKKFQLSKEELNVDP